MRIRLVTSGGFAGIEQVYEASDASPEIQALSKKLETSLPSALSASSAGATTSAPDPVGSPMLAALPSSFADGMTYEIEIEDEAGRRSYSLGDATASSDILSLLDSLRVLLS